MNGIKFVMKYFRRQSDDGVMIMKAVEENKDYQLESVTMYRCFYCNHYEMFEHLMVTHIRINHGIELS